MCDECEGLRKEIDRLKDENEFVNSVAAAYMKAEHSVEGRLIDTIIGEIETFEIKGLTLCDIGDIEDFRRLA